MKAHKRGCYQNSGHSNHFKRMGLKDKSNACEIFRKDLRKTGKYPNWGSGEDVRNVSQANLAFKRKSFDVSRKVKIQFTSLKCSVNTYLFIKRCKLGYIVFNQRK